MFVTWEHPEAPLLVHVDEYIGGPDERYQVTSPETGGTWRVPKAQLVGLGA